MQILGISCFYHDSAAAVVRDGRLVSAAEQERFSRLKHDSAFPLEAVKWNLESLALTPKDIDAIAFYEKPYLKMDRIIKSHFQVWPHSRKSFERALLGWTSGKLNVRGLVKKHLGFYGPVYFCEHHESHAASTYYSSGFEEATIITIDGVGEWATTKIFEGRNGQIIPLLELSYPDSLGLFYSAITQYLGFEVNEGEYKVMGLAPYGEPCFTEQLKANLVLPQENGSFQLNMEYFYFQFGQSMVHEEKWEKLFGFSKRCKSDPIEQFHKDLACSAQVVLEEILGSLVNFAIKRTGIPRVCLAGGVALNCVANSFLSKQKNVQELFVFPAGGDAGGAVGAAFWLAHQMSAKPFQPMKISSMSLGPKYSDSHIKEYLMRARIPFEELTTEELLKRAAQLISNQQIIGWFQENMEFGPRALGHRSILADPTRRENWPKINQRVKGREDFRPLAPAVLRESVDIYFDDLGDSPFMVFVGKNKTKWLPAVTHIDGTSRVQTVSESDSPRFYQLLKEFEKISGHPVLLNTSFNLAGEPIVCTPQDAFRTFVKGKLDHLFIGNFHIAREQLPYLIGE